MIPLRLPAGHPNAPTIQNWAKDKETLLDSHAKRIKQLEGLLRTILTNQPALGKQ